MKKHDVSKCPICKREEALHKYRSLVIRNHCKNWRDKLIKVEDEDFHRKHGKHYGGTT